MHQEWAFWTSQSAKIAASAVEAGSRSDVADRPFMAGNRRLRRSHPRGISAQLARLGPRRYPPARRVERFLCRQCAGDCVRHRRRQSRRPLSRTSACFPGIDVDQRYVLSRPADAVEPRPLLAGPVHGHCAVLSDRRRLLLARGARWRARHAGLDRLACSWCPVDGEPDRSVEDQRPAVFPPGPLSCELINRLASDPINVGFGPHRARQPDDGHCREGPTADMALPWRHLAHIASLGYAFGSYAPLGKAVAGDGGYCLSGVWSFTSGCDHARWLVLGGIVPPTAERPANPAHFRI